MIKTYKILSLFLSYPGTDLQDFLHEGIGELRNEGLLAEGIIKNLDEFAAHFTKEDIIDWQAHYVSLFDTSRKTSLYIFEHLKGDSKDRGSAMTDLMDFFNENGLVLSERELPDYLPVFLEFLSTLDKEKASELLAQPVNVIGRIHTALKESGNIYRHVLDAVLSLSAIRPDDEDILPLKDDFISAGDDESYHGPFDSPGEIIDPGH